MTGTRPDPTKRYHRKMPANWWLQKKSYFLFMLRELSSVFIALFLVVYLVQIYQLTKGPDAYIAFTKKLSSPGWLFFHGGFSYSPYTIASHGFNLQPWYYPYGWENVWSRDRRSLRYTSLLGP